MTLADRVKEALTNTTDEELRVFFPEDNTPKGWVSIEDALPRMLAKDVGRGYSTYRVKYESGNERWTYVSDHDAWYHSAREFGITHWWND